MQTNLLAFRILIICLAQLNKVIKERDEQENRRAKDLKTALIPRPDRIGNLRNAMGMGDEKDVYLKCRVSSFSYDHIYIYILIGVTFQDIGPDGYPPLRLNDWKRVAAPVTR